MSRFKTSAREKNLLMKLPTIFTFNRLFHKSVRSVVSLGAASVLMVAGVAFLGASPASAVGVGTTTVTTSATPSSPQVVTTSVTITAVAAGVSPSGTPTGTVTFEYSTGSGYSPVTGCANNPATLSGGTVQCVTTELPLGTVSLESVYSGDSTYNSNTSPSYAYSIITGSTMSSITVTASPSSPQVVLSNVTLTATVPSPESGTVTFESSTGSGYSVVAGCTGVAIAGTTATCGPTTVLPLGTVDLEAVYSGDHTYSTSTSPAYPYSIIPGTGTTSVSVLATPTSPVSQGTSVSITVNVLAGTPAGVPTGNVTIEYSTGAGYVPVTGCTNPASVSSGTATCITSTLPFGTVGLEALYTGDHTYGAALSPVYPYYVRTSSVTSIGVVPASPVAYGTSVTLTSTVTTGATGTVNFEVSSNDVTFTSIANCTAQPVSVTYVATCTTTVLPTGIDYLEAAYSGNTTYAPTTSTPIYYVVNAASQAAITVTPVAGLVGTSLTLVANGGSGTGAVTFTAVNGTATGCAVTGASLKVTTGGTCVVTATKAADANYLVANSAATTVTFVNPIPKALRVIGAPVEGRTTSIGIAGQYFYGQPTIITNVSGVVARVSKDTGSLLTVIVTAKNGIRHGIYVFALTFKNGQRTNVKYNLR